MKLYSYFRSSAAYRVRIALNLKGLSYEIVPVHLLRGEQKSPEHRQRHPMGLVPVLELADGTTLTQSLAILEYLEEAYPSPPLLPAEPLARAQVRAIAATIACDIHPINNLRVLQYLTGTLGLSEEAKLTWYRHWVMEGLTAVERLVAASAGRFCLGDAPTLADCCLVPQLYNARRFDCDLSGFPRLTAIEAACQALEAFRAAAPERQPDAM